MPGDFDAVVGAFERKRALEARLARTAEVGERRAIRERLDAAEREVRDAIKALKAAAEAGDAEAIAVLRELGV